MNERTLFGFLSYSQIRNTEYKIKKKQKQKKTRKNKNTKCKTQRKQTNYQID